MAMTRPVVQAVVPVTGQTVQMRNSDNTSTLVLVPVGPIASLTINFPLNPTNAQCVTIVASQRITVLTLTGSTFSSSPSTMYAQMPLSFIYESSTSTWWMTDNGSDLTAATALMALYRGKPFTVSTTSGTAVIYLTDDGLITGNALFQSIDYVHLDFVSNDPNFGKSFTLSGVTLTITAVKQAFTGITLLSTNILGSVAIAAAANGTQLNVLVVGKLN